MNKTNMTYVWQVSIELTHGVLSPLERRSVNYRVLADDFEKVWQSVKAGLKWNDKVVSIIRKEKCGSLDMPLVEFQK